MQRFIQIISRAMDFVAKNVLKIVFTLVFIVGLIIKPMYCFDDSPYFEVVKLLDIVVGILVIILFAIIYDKRDYIQERFQYIYGFIIFVVISCIFIILVPLKPFSDMQYIYQSAIDFANFNWNDIMAGEYWQKFSSNIYLGVFWGFLIMFLPKKLITFKLINMLFAFGIIYFTGKLCKEYGYKYDKVIYFMLIFFSPIILYENHIYCEMPFVFFCTIALYVWKKYNNIYVFAGIIGIARYLRSNATIFLLAVMFAILFSCIKEKADIKIWIKKLANIISMFLIFMVIFKVLIFAVDSKFDRSEFKQYPKWNQFYIGINEAEFGFMDNDFSYDRTLQDVIDRVNEYGPVRMTKIFVKKIHWTWMQGTYQADRYGFGINTISEEEKFEYSTIATKHLLNDAQRTRKIINSFMRNQYVVLFFLMIVMLWKSKDISDKREIYYVIIATFLALIVYEMKSRFIFHCIPLMAILACGAFEIDISKLKVVKAKRLKGLKHPKWRVCEKNSVN